MAREAFGEVATTLKTLDEKQRAEFPNVHIVIDHAGRSGTTRNALSSDANKQCRIECTGAASDPGPEHLHDDGHIRQWRAMAASPHGDPYTRKVHVSTFGSGFLPYGQPFSALKTCRRPSRSPRRKPSARRTGEGAWIDRLGALSQTADIPIMADYYRSPALVHDLTDTGKDLIRHAGRSRRRRATARRRLDCPHISYGVFSERAVQAKRVSVVDDGQDIASAQTGLVCAAAL